MNSLININECNKNEQLKVCEKYSVEFLESPEYLKVGISINAKNGQFPINGMRHTPENGTTGWYIWGGEKFSEDSDFFIPLHVKHLSEWCPQILKYLGLPVGYRFLIGENNYEDVWQDISLLNS